jgi:hypothetical protein
MYIKVGGGGNILLPPPFQKRGGGWPPLPPLTMPVSEFEQAVIFYDAVL